MSDAPTPVKLTPAEKAVADAREHLARYLGRAVQIITELAETSENDRVRLAAAQDIADRAGLGKSSTLQVSQDQGQHEALDSQAAELVSRIRENAVEAARGPAGISIDALVVHEGETAS